MTIAYKINARWLCLRPCRYGSGVKSDGEDGPIDGAGEVHPERVFNLGLHSRGLEGLDID